MPKAKSLQWSDLRQGGHETYGRVAISFHSSPPVIPAKAGTQYAPALGHRHLTSRNGNDYLAPAFAGVTVRGWAYPSVIGK